MYYINDMYNLQLPASEFDVLVVHQVLHYAQNPAAVILEASQTLRPGGKLLVVDFSTHDQEFLRTAHQHRWLGFEREQGSVWCTAAGLQGQATIELGGRSLTVLNWLAVREGVAPS